MSVTGVEDAGIKLQEKKKNSMTDLERDWNKEKKYILVFFFFFF